MKMISTKVSASTGLLLVVWALTGMQSDSGVQTMPAKPGTAIARTLPDCPATDNARIHCLRQEDHDVSLAFLSSEKDIAVRAWR
jgi:hypothetical protein